MTIAHYVAWFWGGAFLMNALPHVVAGSLGRPFQSPFATPRGEGLSSSTVNMLWGFFNFAVAWALLARAGSFDPRDWSHALAAGAGGLLMGFFHARHFGRFHGGNSPQ